MNIKNLKDIVQQLEKCNYTDKLGHKLTNNKAFVILKNHVNCDNCDNPNVEVYYCESCLENAYESNPTS